MNLLRRLRQEEKAQVLYMTIVAMMFLAVFTLVLVNVIYMCVMKVKAQNAADNIALSVATMRARAFNTMTDLNGVIELIGLQFSTIHYHPYASSAEAGVYGGIIDACILLGQSKMLEYNQHLDQYISDIYKGNGLDDVLMKAKFFPAQMEPWQVDLKYERLMYLQEVSWAKVPLPVLWTPFTAITPNAGYLFVQSRVEWPLRGNCIGFKNLGVVLPDLVTRAKAEIIGTSFPLALPAQCSTYYHVRLAQPDDAMDQKIKNQDWIW
jgi:hypothetical protein